MSGWPSKCSLTKCLLSPGATAIYLAYVKTPPCRYISVGLECLSHVRNTKLARRFYEFGRGERIGTSDPLHPMLVTYLR